MSEIIMPSLAFPMGLSSRPSVAKMTNFTTTEATWTTKKIISEYKGQVRFRPPLWGMGGAHKPPGPKKKKVSENNGQLHFCPPPRVEYTSNLDQQEWSMF